MNDFASTPEGALIIACAFGALMIALILWRTAGGARARASEKARAWAELKRPEWEERASRKREARASGARADARLRIALLSAVALVAIAATNLSAHATINAIRRAGLDSVDAAISVVIVFEAFLMILGALSWWHMNRGTGPNWYEVGVWSMAALMGIVAWWGGHNPIFALWPLLAAIAWHVVITFGREHKQSALITWWRMKRGKATSQDANVVLTERLITAIVDHGYAANEGARALRAFHERAFNRAWARADALGILTPEVRARIQTRIAARYAGARALAPEKVEHMNPWNERAMSAPSRSARTVRPVSAPPAPAVEVSAHGEVSAHDERASEDERATEVAETITVPTYTESAYSKGELVEAIEKFFASKNMVAKEWAKTFVETNGVLPNGDDLARFTRKTAANCRKWMAPVRKELGLS
jgi:hypothetical protein